jgi:hypothetical protein
MVKCIAVVFAASALFLAGCCATPQAAKWEYKVASPHFADAGGHPAVREAQQALLNDLGKEGWVLVSQTEGRDFYFKRPVR